MCLSDLFFLFFLPSVQSTVSSVSPGMVRSINVSNCFIVHVRRCQASCPPLLIPPATPCCFYLSAQPSCTHSFLLNPRHPSSNLVCFVFFSVSGRQAAVGRWLSRLLVLSLGNWTGLTMFYQEAERKKRCSMQESHKQTFSFMCRSGLNYLLLSGFVLL